MTSRKLSKQQKTILVALREFENRVQPWHTFYCLILTVTGEAGGVTFAEEENSASFFGMPRSAIQTGCVDFILNPRDIAKGLIGISRQYRLPKGTEQIE